MDKRSKLIASLAKGMVLDIGFSVGPLNKYLKESNDSVIGMDITIKKPEKLVIKGDSTKMPLKSNIFDAIIAGELIEHINEPEKLIEACNYILKINGLFIITTPNRGSLLNRVTHSYEAPAHISLLNKTELSDILIKNGFKIEDYQTLPYTKESSDGSKHEWFFFFRKIIHHFLPKSLREEMIFVARKL